MSPVAEIETELARAARLGNRQALEELTGRLYQPVCALAMRFFPRPDEAADIAQETFARISLRIADYDPRQRFASWVFSIAANLCRDRYRREQTVRFCEWSESTDVSIDAPPEDRAIRLEDEQIVNRAVDSLPFDLRMVVLLHFQQDMAASEIAESLGVSVNAVRIRLYRALGALRKSVKE
jgi:RNA polymerase sigma-70 factor, ECF subfamily